MLIIARSQLFHKAFPCFLPFLLSLRASKNTTVCNAKGTSRLEYGERGDQKKERKKGRNDGGLTHLSFLHSFPDGTSNRFNLAESFLWRTPLNSGSGFRAGEASEERSFLGPRSLPRRSLLLSLSHFRTVCISWQVGRYSISEKFRNKVGLIKNSAFLLIIVFFTINIILCAD